MTKNINVPAWDRWKELTSFLHLSDHVLQSQKEQWRSLPIANKSEIKILRNNGRYKYETTGDVYDATLEDRHVLSSVVLLSSYALMETIIRNVYDFITADISINTPILNSIRSSAISIEDIIKIGGIEVWATKLLTDLGRNWNYVEAGKAGIVEASIVRNSFAHGEQFVTTSMINRANGNGATLPWQVGHKIELSIDQLREYRHRLRSLARVIHHGGEELFT